MAVTKTANVNVRIQENMDEKTFNALMAKGYDQAVRGDSYPIDDVFEELEQGL